MSQNSERKKGRPSRDSFWVQVIHRWEKSGLSQAEFCKKEGIKVNTFRCARARLFDRPKKSGRTSIRQIIRSDGTSMVVVSLSSGCQVAMDQVEAMELRDVLARYYAMSPEATEADLLDAADLAQQRLNDFRLRKYH